MWDNGFYSSSLFSSSLCFWKKFENWFDRRWLDLPREKDFKDKILFLFSLSLSKWKIDKEIVILIRARITFGGSLEVIKDEEKQVYFSSYEQFDAH